jgi:hypothetical protein
MSQQHYCLAVLVLALGCGGGERPPAAPTTVSTLCPATGSAPPAPASASAALPAVIAPAPAAPLATGLKVELKNPLGQARSGATIALRLADVQKLRPSFQATKAVVQGPNGSAVLSQLVDSDGDGRVDELVFQADLGPNEQKTFLLGEGARSTPNRDQFRAYGRFARERHDDFAWENDRMAHRMYGAALETYAPDPLTSSGIDVWVKRTPHLVVNDWYVTDDYHRDNGDGGDFYSVGPSRGCGGLGIWDGKELRVSHNFTSSRVLANGPIRLIFELDYAPWDVGGGVKLSETKRVTVDAGRHFDRFESSFKITGKPRNLTLAVGIAKHAGGVFETDQPNGVLRSWEPFSGDSGHVGCAVINTSGPATGFAENATDRLLLSALPNGAPATYLAGFGWDKGGDVPDSAAWAAVVNDAVGDARNPVQVSLSAP